MRRRDLTAQLGTVYPQGEEPRLVVDATLRVLAANNDPRALFVRGGQLVRLVHDELGRPRLETLDDASLRTELIHRVSFRRKTTKKVPAPPPEDVPAEDAAADFKDTPIDPPRTVVQSLRTLGGWPGIPPVEAIVETPTLRADGSVLDEAGYDTATRLYYAPEPNLDIGRVPVDPTASQLRKAIELIRDDLLGDFPFAAAADQANAIALLLTPVVRPAVGCVPLALVDAPRAGTGKGLLASVAARITTGRPAGVFAAPDDEKEWGKALTAILDDGASFVLIDEAAHLRSAQLAAALTADVHTARRLGHTELVRVPQRATWVAAGNNIAVGGDLPRRCYRIRLDPKTARPWTRDGFRHADLEGWAAGRRGSLLRALLVVARAWYAADKPAAPTPVLGGFNTWAQTIGGILAHAGIDGFLGNLPDLYTQSDDDANQFEAFLLAAAAAFPDTKFDTGQLDAAIRNTDSIRDALPDDLQAKLGAAGFRVSLGKALRAKVDTRHGDAGVRIVQAGTTRNKTPLWAIEADHELRGVRGVAGVVVPISRERTDGPSGQARVGNWGVTPPPPSTPPAEQTEAGHG
jgi:hypothetical protein